MNDGTEHEVTSTAPAKAQPTRKKTGRPKKNPEAEARGAETMKGRVAELECIEEGLGWDEIM